MQLSNLIKSVFLTLTLSFSASAQELFHSVLEKKTNVNTTSEAIALYPSNRNERFFIQALRSLHGAQVTYQATTGNGNFGSLLQLAQDGLIKEALASGSIYGYSYTVSKRDREVASAAAFEIVAVPRLYRKTGVRSFFMEADGIIKGADKLGAAANRNDPTIEEEYTCHSVTECEAFAINTLRMLYGAQITYQSAEGFGNYGSLCQLAKDSLIDQILAQGTRFGYYFMVSKRDKAGEQRPASFEIRAIPHDYPTTGIRSFFVGTEGVIHGADRAGAPINSDAPAIEYK
jgi:hypothetical protein